MPKCPKCGKDIEQLTYVADEIHRYIFYKAGEDFTYEEDDMWNGDWQSFLCPECDEKLFEDEKAAKEFLNKT